MDEMTGLADLGADLSPSEVPRERLWARTASTADAAVAIPRRRWLVHAAVAASLLAFAAGAAAVAGALAPAGTTHAVVAKPAAFTLVKNADGSVTFTVHQLLNLDAATKALNDAGIVGRVVTSTENCTTGPNKVPIDPNDLYPADTYHRLGNHGQVTGTDTVTLRTSDYPQGGGVLVTVGGDVRRDGTLHLVVGYLAYKDVHKIPTCVNFVDPGTGNFPAWPPVGRGGR
jgi:hypothetical protein